MSVHILHPDTNHPVIGITVIAPPARPPRVTVRGDENATVVVPESMRTRMGTLMGRKNHGRETLLPIHLPSGHHIGAVETTTRIKIRSEAAIAHIVTTTEAGSQTRVTAPAKSGPHLPRSVFMEQVG